jgi:hypothetical protein
MICKRDWEGYHVCRKRFLTVLCLLTICLCMAMRITTGHAESTKVPEESKQEDPEKKKGTKSSGRLLPIPIFLTEPAFGYGLGVALGYIHPAKDDTGKQEELSLHTLGSASAERSGQKPPPTITGIGGGYTTLDTWAAAVAHSTSWRKDTIRYAGGIIYADVKSTFYDSLDRSLDFNLKGFGLYQGLKFRMGNSRFFLGGKLLLLETDSQFDITLGEDTEIGADDILASNVGFAASVTYDGRDNVFTPNTGQLLQFDIWLFDEAFGGDYDYWRANLKLLSFYQLHPRFVLGLRVAASTLDGPAPFFAYPYVSLRGIPALRYQGKTVGTIEVEGRWNILPRWAIVGFAGTGAVYSREISGSKIVKDDIFAGGAGVRYFLMRDLGLWLGIDVARGPEDWYSYVVVGQAW